MFKLKEYIFEIEKTGSFSQAAANLFVSQPALSAFVKRLEEKIGEPLFDRSVSPVKLTECGKEYVKSAKMISQAEENFISFLEEYSGCAKGKLIIGGSNLNLTVVLTPILKMFKAVYPGIQIELIEGNIDALCELLKDGKLDFVVDSCDMDQNQFSEYVYRTEHLLLAVPAAYECNERLLPYQMNWEDILHEKHLRTEVSSLPLKLLNGIPFLMMKPETDTGKRTNMIIQKEEFQPNVLFSFQQHSTMFHMACAGMGAALISDQIVLNSYSKPELLYYKIGGNDTLRNIRFYKKKEKRMNYAMKALLETAGILPNNKMTETEGEKT